MIQKKRRHKSKGLITILHSTWAISEKNIDEYGRFTKKNPFLKPLNLFQVRSQLARGERQGTNHHHPSSSSNDIDSFGEPRSEPRAEGSHSAAGCREAISVTTAALVLAVMVMV